MKSKSAARRICAFFFISFFCVSFVACAEKESFVIKKTSKKKSGRKTKEKLCRARGKCIKALNKLTENAARVQGLYFEETVQYIDGDDPFVGLKKNDAQNQIAALEKLEKQIAALCDELDRCFSQWKKKVSA